MKEKIDLLYSPKIYTLKLNDDSYKFYSYFDLKKFLNNVDLSKYNFVGGVR